MSLAASRSSEKVAEKYRKSRDAIAERMTPDQIAEAERLASEWRPKTLDRLNFNAANWGDAGAQFGLGWMFQHGIEYAQNSARAVRWYRKAAEQGHTDAQVNLAAMYATGEGVRRDYVQAHKWMSVAASNARGQDAEKDRKGRDAVAEKMTPDQLAEAQQLAREWKPKTWDQLKDQAAK